MGENCAKNQNILKKITYSIESELLMVYNTDKNIVLIFRCFVERENYCDRNKKRNT